MSWIVMPSCCLSHSVDALGFFGALQWKYSAITLGLCHRSWIVLVKKKFCIFLFVLLFRMERLFHCCLVYNILHKLVRRAKEW